MGEPKRVIVTFYSYKGGVGRSMALANVAWLLSSKYGRKVLVVDWDLEAPGLHRFFGVKPERIEAGLIDLFDEYKKLLKGDAEALPPKLADVERCLINIPVAGDSPEGSLAILGAGKQDTNYAARVNEFDWNEFYKEWHGYGFFEFLKGELKEKAEIVLLDSRTGVTDIGGICTLQLPDAVILLFALNEQNISGTELIADSILKRAPEYSERDSPPALVVRPSRVEKYLEQDLKNDWEERASQRLGKYLPPEVRRDSLRFFKQNSIPYVGAYSFGETPLAVQVGRHDEPALSFDALAVALLKACGLWEEDAEVAAKSAAAEGAVQGRPEVLIYYSRRDERWKERLARHVRVLQDQGLLVISEREFSPADSADPDSLRPLLRTADIIIPLVSANSLTSEFLLDPEVSKLFRQRAEKGLRVFPLIVEPCEWQAVGWLWQMNLRPTDGRPVSAGSEHQIDADLAALTSELYLLTKSGAAAPPRTFVPLNPDDISIGRLPVTGRELFGRELELDMLDGAWADANTNVLTLVAWGGVGKSALVNHWRRRMARDNYRGAEKVHAWSFYRQGMSEQGVSADQFIDAALRWFGDTDPTAGTPWDKGERLARLVKKQRTLLFLDGLEPLQFPPGRGHQEGALKEHSMQAFLRELAAYNPGLCVITSRLAVADLEDSEGDTARRINLEHLSPQASAELLRAQGVRGEQAELERAAAEFGGHALALTLLGSYLTNVHGGDVARREKVNLLSEDEASGGQTQRIMASYEKWFGEGPELSVLRLLGLFDGPADYMSIAALRAAPAIQGLTDTLQGLTDEDWRRTLNRLRNARLIDDRDPDHRELIVTHPLVQEYFSQSLKRTHPEAWREGHSRLYEHLRDTTQEFPDTIEDMAPLYAAMAHGYAAGRSQEALDEVYVQRIRRGNTAFNTRVLGAYGADLSVLVNFFEVPWSQTVAGLDERTRSFIFNEAGATLLALGRLSEAVVPLQASLESRIAQAAWDSAAVSASNLSNIYLTSGDLSQSSSYAQQGVEWADRSGNEFLRSGIRASLADAMHQAGRLSEAKTFFREAEAILGKQQPQFPKLYSQPGFKYCDFLLGRGEWQEVLRRAEAAIKIANNYGWLLDTALGYLSFGQALLLQSQREVEGDLSRATEYLHRAVEALRQAGVLSFLPLGLLTRAEMFHIKSEFERARTDLDEAISIATRRGMGLLLADCHLAYARLFSALGERDKAREHTLIAREMIERMGYHRRDDNLRELLDTLGE